MEDDILCFFLSRRDFDRLKANGLNVEQVLISLIAHSGFFSEYMNYNLEWHEFAVDASKINFTIKSEHFKDLSIHNRLMEMDFAKLLEIASSKENCNMCDYYRDGQCHFNPPVPVYSGFSPTGGGKVRAEYPYVRGYPSCSKMEVSKPWRAIEIYQLEKIS